MGLKDIIKMNCESASALVEKKREKKLTRGEKVALFIHLLWCDFCGLFFKQSAILDESAKSFAKKIDDGQKTYPMSEGRKESIAKAFSTELKS